jgi:hypothetical protein
MRRIVGGVLAAALQAIPTSVSDMITVPPAGVPFPTFRPSFTWTCLFKEKYSTGVDEYEPLVLEIVKPLVIIRHIEVNEGAAPNKFNIQIEHPQDGLWNGSRGTAMLIGTCFRD